MGRVDFKLAICILLPALCGAAPAWDDITSITEQIVEVMKTIKDAKSAKAAAAKLDPLADKMLGVREEIKKALREQANSGEPARLAAAGRGQAGKQASAMKAYTKELERISSMSGTPQLLDGFIKKMKPDAELVDLLGKAMEGALEEQAKSAAAKPMDLSPDPNFKDKVADVDVSSLWRKWFPTAKKGDFVQIAEKLGGTRHEVLEVAGETIVVASVHQIGRSKLETRVRMRYGPEAEKPPPGFGFPEPKLAGTETITVQGRALLCQVKKDGKHTAWYCDDVPFDGLVKEESPNGQMQLVSFGRGTGPSPNVVLAAPSAADPATAVPLSQGPGRRNSPPPSSGRTAESPQPDPKNAAAVQQKIEDQQAKMEECRQEIDRLNGELDEAKSSATGLEKKLKRLAVAASKSKRSKDSKAEFERELKETRKQISKLESEIKTNEGQVTRCEKEIESLQTQAAGAR